MAKFWIERDTTAFGWVTVSSDGNPIYFESLDRAEAFVEADINLWIAAGEGNVRIASDVGPPLVVRAGKEHFESFFEEGFVVRFTLVYHDGSQWKPYLVHGLPLEFRSMNEAEDYALTCLPTLQHGKRFAATGMAVDHTIKHEVRVPHSPKREVVAGGYRG